MLKVGERAPEIEATATDGSRFVLSRQGGLCTVVYFFPKAFTPGCTVETRYFRDNHVEIALAGAQIVGISTDDQNTQCRFADAMKTPFPMIADADLAISRAYGVLRPLIGLARRVTFVVGPDMTIEAVFEHELRVKQHRDKVLAFIDERFRATRPIMTPSQRRHARLPSAPAVREHGPLADAGDRSGHAAGHGGADLGGRVDTGPVRAVTTSSAPPPHAPRDGDSSPPSPGKSPGTSRAADPRGTIIAGRFAIERRVASGASGDIFRGVDRATGAKVAIKMLRGGPGRDDARFEREATILAEMRHPGIVAYVAHGIEPSGEAYLATEWLDGENLAKRLSRAPMSVDETVALGIQVANALGAAHSLGIVHRDLKPTNLFLVGPPRAGADDADRGVQPLSQVKLLDFGVSRMAGAEGQITAPGDVIGSPGYMAPEQARGKGAIDARADVFALGCVLFRCATGQAAFQGNDMVALLMSVLRSDPPRAGDVNPAIPPALSDLIARMLSKSPDGRPANGHAVAAELDALARHAAAPAWPAHHAARRVDDGGGS